MNPDDVFIDAEDELFVRVNIVLIIWFYSN
jgi:hypothetical protein